jgi:hypothetical protein
MRFSSDGFWGAKVLSHYHHSVIPFSFSPSETQALPSDPSCILISGNRSFIYGMKSVLDPSTDRTYGRAAA